MARLLKKELFLRLPLLIIKIWVCLDDWPLPESEFDHHEAHNAATAARHLHTKSSWGGGRSILAPPKNMISQYAPESRYTKNELKVTNIRRHEHFNMYPDLYWTRRLKRICIQHNNHNKSCKLSLYIFLITLKTYSTLDYNYQGIYNCQGNRITVPRVRYSRLKAMQCSVVRARFFFAYYWWF